MLKTTCVNPEIMKAIAYCGHGDKVLIADGNYPLASKSGNAAKIYLGVTKGLPSVIDVLTALNGVVNFEKAEVMMPEDGNAPDIFNEFTGVLNGMALDRLGRFEFYDACSREDVRIGISTGEIRLYANILLTISVV